MKFPRNVRVFKGELNAAPLVSVLFLLLLFILFTTLVYTPGIPVTLDDSPGQTNGLPILLTAKGDAVFNGRTNSTLELEPLRRAIGSLPPGTTLSIRPEPGAPKEAVNRVRELIRNSGRVELPTASGLSGTTNRTVAVAVNLAGQLFFRNQLVTEMELSQLLRTAAQERPSPLTVVLLADRSVDNETLTRLHVLARNAGAKELLLASRPRLFDSVMPAASPQ